MSTGSECHRLEKKAEYGSALGVMLSFKTHDALPKKEKKPNRWIGQTLLHLQSSQDPPGSEFTRF